MLFDHHRLVPLLVSVLLGLPAVGCQDADNTSNPDNTSKPDASLAPDEAGANACTLQEDCDGELAGRWEIFEICGDGTFTADPPSAGVTPVEQQVLEASGWVEFHPEGDGGVFGGADGQYEMDVTSTTREVVERGFDPDLLDDFGNTPEEFCSTTEESFEEAMDTHDVETAWECEVFSETICRCTVETTVRVAESGDYAVDGDEVEFRERGSRTATFCAQGNSLHLKDSRLFRGVGLGKVADDEPTGVDAGPSGDTGDDAGPSGTTGSFAVTIDGQTLDMPKLDVLEQGGALVVTATSADMASTYGITLMSPSTGTNECDSVGLTTMSYTTDAGALTYQSGGGAGGSCSLELTTVEDGHLAGTFQAELEATQGGSGTTSVTDGSFDVQY